MSRSDEELVADALTHLALQRRHLTRGDLDDRTIADAVTLRLAASIEAIAKSSDGLRTRAFGDDWALIWATRNRIAHGYAFSDMSIAAATVADDLPWFEEQLQQEAHRRASDRAATRGVVLLRDSRPPDLRRRDAFGNHALKRSVSVAAPGQQHR